jgi:hypothetical protein
MIFGLTFLGTGSIAIISFTVTTTFRKSMLFLGKKERKLIEALPLTHHQ